MTHGPVKMTAR